MTWMSHSIDIPPSFKMRVGAREDGTAHEITTAHSVAPAASESTLDAISLGDLARGAFATIAAVLPAQSDEDRDLVLRLIEIGFVPGERLRVVAHGRPGREPIAVRLCSADSGRRSTSGTTFALRRFEAERIRVVPDSANDDEGGAR